MIDLRKKEFFRRFIAFDCTDANDGFDAEAVQWFHPAEMQTVIRRLWAFGGSAHGMDVAEHFGAGKGSRGGSWGIVAGTSPREKDSLDAWLELLSKDALNGCLVSISYAIPEAVLALFVPERR